MNGRLDDGRDGVCPRNGVTNSSNILCLAGPHDIAKSSCIDDHGVGARFHLISWRWSSASRTYGMAEALPSLAVTLGGVHGVMVGALGDCSDLPFRLLW